MRQRADFLRTFQKGEHRKTLHFRVSLCPNHLPQKRLGITVGKKVGGAVGRNRLKRMIREFFRLNKDLFPGSSDVVISAREGAADLNYWQLSEELRGVCQER